MSTASPAHLDPTQLYFHMPPPAPAPAPAPVPVRTSSSKMTTFEIFKLIISFIIALLLIAILVAFLFLSRENKSSDLRESNEHIARLEREHELTLEKQREAHMEKMAEEKRVIEQTAERQRQEFQLFLTLEKLRREQDMQQRQLDLMLRGQRQAEEAHQEELNKDNENALQKFMDDVSAMSLPYDVNRIRLRVLSLLRRLNPEQKSSLISFLYHLGLLSSDGTAENSIDLRGVDLKELNLNDIGEDLDFVEILANFSHLALPATNLINATFKKVFLGTSSFQAANLTGASFRSSFVIGANFQQAQLSLSDFRQANAMESRFTAAKIHSATFAEAELFASTFGRADIANSKFTNAKLAQANFNGVLAPGADFYSAQAYQTDFSFSYMPDAKFQYANLYQSSFRSAYLTGVNFDSASVFDVDFTRAYLVGANITNFQLDLALSVAYASLPDGTIGRNKNLLRKASANCSDNDGNIYEWIMTGQVTAEQNQTTKQCQFQGMSPNATLEQRIDITRYQPLLREGRGRVYIELQNSVTPDSAPLVHMNVDFLNADENLTGATQNTLNNYRFTPPSTFISSVSCPHDTTQLRLTLVFSQINATVHNIYVTLE